MSRSPTRLRSVAVLLAVTTLCVWIRPAPADITATSGAITEIAHPTGTLSSNTLESDGTFAPTSLTYNGLSARQYELGTGSNRDRYSISSDGRTLTIIQTRSGGNGVDQLRILVNPEPGTAALVGVGVVGRLGLVVRRRRRRRRCRGRWRHGGSPFLLDSPRVSDDEPFQGEPEPDGTSFAGSSS